MADPTLHTVVDALVTAFAAATGAKYEPGASGVKALSDKLGDLSSIGADTFYAVIPDLTERSLTVEHDTGDDLTGTLPVEVMVYRRVSAQGTQIQDAARWEVAADVVTDIEQKLRAAEDGRGSGVVVTYWVGPLELQWDWQDQWVGVSAKFEVRYRKSRTTR